jgi:hypothetical protein
MIEVILHIEDLVTMVWTSFKRKPISVLGTYMNGPLRTIAWTPCFIYAQKNTVRGLGCSVAPSILFGCSQGM